MAATLTISHYIYLTREERYGLFRGEKLETTGISVPVWFRKGDTSEPAQEVFCKYIITNSLSFKSIVQTDEGYALNLPQTFYGKDNSTTAKKLLDVEDGGCEELTYRQYSKIDKNVGVVHFIEIKPIEILLDTLD
jgi:hypothetical protein